jgi:hypothetical protein
MDLQFDPIKCASGYAGEPEHRVQPQQEDLRQDRGVAEPAHRRRGKFHLFVAIDRTSKFAFAQLHEKANRNTAAAFLKDLIAVVPYNIHTVLTDNGIQFCDLPKNHSGPTTRWRTHIFDLLCRSHEIEHRLTKPNHPWTNGQVERMSRTRGDCPALSLRQPRPATPTPRRVPRRLQLSQAPQNLEGAHALRIHLQSLNVQNATHLNTMG